MKNFNKKIIMTVLIDIALILVSYLLAIFGRFGRDIPLQDISVLRVVLHVILPVYLIFFYLFGLYRISWRYAGGGELLQVIKATAAAAAIVTVYAFFVRAMAISRVVLFLHWVFTTILVSAARFSLKIYSDIKRPATTEYRKKALIVGAGEAGADVVREILKHPDVDMSVCGFIDDNPSKKNTLVHGTRVLGSRKELQGIVESLGITDILVAIPSAGGAVIREIIQETQMTGARLLIVPGIWDIIRGTVNLHQIRPLKPEDLLGRETIEIDTERIIKMLGNKKILVTGAGGSIGSELVRQLLEHRPAEIVMLDISELNLYKIQIETTDDNPGIKKKYIIADICDKTRMEEVFGVNKPEIVFHAAAYKHVPLMEENPRESLRVNVTGTDNLAGQASQNGCETFVFISSDKAVKPCSIMGASKRLAELLIKTYEAATETRFISVRFGNVINSSGSVVPLFEKQIQTGGPVTVTHPEAVRYFMTIPEAVRLVLQAAASNESGLFFLDMGEPIRILDIARQLILLSGKIPEHDIKIIFTGLRPGEKLKEELTTDREDFLPTEHPKILRVPLPAQSLKRGNIIDTTSSMMNMTYDDIRKTLKDTIPDYLNK